MTPKKLQKMCYFAYAWFLTLANDDINNLTLFLFSNKFQAWVHGPANLELYQKYKDYGYRDIEQYNGDLYNFSPYTCDILQQVKDVYGVFSADELEAISHQETPWIQARGNLSYYEPCYTVLEDKEIYKYYVNKLHNS